jgi:hypothetical protein
MVSPCTVRKLFRNSVYNLTDWNGDLAGPHSTPENRRQARLYE